MPLVRFWRSIVKFCSVGREIFPFGWFGTHKYLFSFRNHFFVAPILFFKPAFFVVGLPLSSSNDLPSRLPSSPPPRNPTHHVSTPSSLPSSAPVHLAGHLPNTGKFKATNKNSGGCAEDQKRPRKGYNMPTSDFHF